MKENKKRKNCELEVEGSIAIVEQCHTEFAGLLFERFSHFCKSKPNLTADSFTILFYRLIHRIHCPNLFYKQLKQRAPKISSARVDLSNHSSHCHLATDHPQSSHFKNLYYFDRLPDPYYL